MFAPHCVLKDNFGTEFGIFAHRAREFWSLPGSDRLNRHAFYRRCRGVLLDASSIAAAAQHTIGKDRDMAAFAGHTGHAVPNLAVEHDARANTGAKREHAHRVGIATGAHPLLSQSCYVCVVLQDHLAIEPALDLIAHRIFRPVGQVGRLKDRASLHLDDSGYANSGSREFAAGIELLAQRPNRVANVADDKIAPAFDFGTGRDEFELLAVLVDGSDAHVSATKVHTDGEAVGVNHFEWDASKVRIVICEESITRFLTSGTSDNNAFPFLQAQFA